MISFHLKGRKSWANVSQSPRLSRSESSTLCPLHLEPDLQFVLCLNFILHILRALHLRTHLSRHEPWRKCIEKTVHCTVWIGDIQWPLVVCVHHGCRSASVQKYLCNIDLVLVPPGGHVQSRVSFIGPSPSISTSVKQCLNNSRRVRLRHCYGNHERGPSFLCGKIRISLVLEQDLSAFQVVVGSRTI